MSDREFLFAMHLGPASRFDDLLTELVGQVLRHLGYTDRDVAELVSSVRAELARDETRDPDGPSIQFRAREGQFQIVMSQSGGREWRMARPLP